MSDVDISEIVSEDNEQLLAWDKLKVSAAALDDNDNNEQSSEQVSEDDDIESAALVGQVVVVMGAVFAPNWKLTEKECMQLGEVYGALLDKYLPDSGLSRYGLELSALMVTASIMQSRAGIPPRLKPPSDDDEKKAIEHEKSDDKKTAIDAAKLDNMAREL